MRFLLSFVLFILASAPRAQTAVTFEGTWYATEPAMLTPLRSSSDSTGGPVEAVALNTLELHVEGDSLSGTAYRELTLPPGADGNKDPVTLSVAPRALRGRVSGPLARFEMDTGRGDALTCEATLSPDGRRLSQRFVSSDSEDAGRVLVFEREPPKPETRKAQ